MIVGLRIILRRGAGTMYGRETEHLRSVALPAHSRLIGISGRHEPRQIVALSFTYYASAEVSLLPLFLVDCCLLIKAFDPGLFQGNADNQHRVDTGNEVGEDQQGRGMQNQTDWTPILATAAVLAIVLGFPIVRRFIMG